MTIIHNLARKIVFTYMSMYETSRVYIKSRALINCASLHLGDFSCIDPFKIVFMSKFTQRGQATLPDQQNISLHGNIFKGWKLFWISFFHQCHQLTVFQCTTMTIKPVNSMNILLCSNTTSVFQLYEKPRTLWKLWAAFGTNCSE